MLKPPAAPTFHKHALLHPHDSAGRIPVQSARWLEAAVNAESVSGPVLAPPSIARFHPVGEMPTVPERDAIAAEVSIAFHGVLI